MMGVFHLLQPKEGQCRSALVGAFGSDAVTRRSEGGEGCASNTFKEAGTCLALQVRSLRCCLDLVCWHQWFFFSQDSCSH